MEDNDDESGRRIRKILLFVVVLGIVVGSSVAVHKQGLVSFLSDIYDILAVSLCMGGALLSSFFLIHGLFCLLARDWKFFLNVRSQIRKIGVYRIALISAVLLAALINFLVTQERALQGWVHASVVAFLLRIAFFGLGGLNPKRGK